MAEILEQNQCFSIRHLAVNGDDLLDLGYSRRKRNRPYPQPAFGGCDRWSLRKHSAKLAGANKKMASDIGSILTFRLEDKRSCGLMKAYFIKFIHWDSVEHLSAKRWTSENRIRKVSDWIGHIQSLHANTIYFSPLFESDAHGYDTRDYRKLDCRLGTNEDFSQVCNQLHAADIKVVLDGVFNHVGRGFWAFQDVLKNREQSPYKNWFHIDFGGNSNYNDGFWYEGWEGHFELVKLNLRNEEVIQQNFFPVSANGWKNSTSTVCAWM